MAKNTKNTTTATAMTVEERMEAVKRAVERNPFLKRFVERARANHNNAINTTANDPAIKKIIEKINANKSK